MTTHFTPSGSRVCLAATLLALCACKQDYEISPEPVNVDPGDVTDCGFTRVDDTEFYEYDCNPVFTTTGEEWAANVGSTAFSVTYVMDHPFYQLWYVAYDEDGNYGMGYAVSNNGTDWEPYPDNPLITQEDEDVEDFETSIMQANEVVWDPDRSKYVMIYSGLDLRRNGGDGGTGVMTSPDGIDWDRLDANPVLWANDTGVDGISGFCWPLDINLANGGYTGYIAGTRGSTGPCQAYRLDAQDPSTWTVDPDIAFHAGEDGEWDDEGLIGLNEAVLDDEHHLFYVGFGDWLEDEENNVRTANHSFLGWARSEDGEDWDNEPEPVPINQTEEGEVSAVGAVTVGERIHLWVTDEYEEGTGVGLFLFDPEAAEAEDEED